MSGRGYPFEDKRMIEIHGLRCTKGAAIDEPGGTEITVQDAPPHVRVNQRHCTFPAMLTPDEAEWIAKQLTESADRVRRSPHHKNHGG